MAKKIFIAATGQNCGKTTTSIGLMHLALKKYRNVGFFKPLGPKPAIFQRHSVDKDAALIAQVFELEKSSAVSGLQDKAVFYEWFRQLTPFGVTLLILGVYPLLCGQKRIAAFYCLAFLYGLLFLMVVAPGDNPRYISNLYPLGVVVSVFSLVWWSRKVVAVLVQRRVSLQVSRPVVLGIVLSLAIGHLAIFENWDVSKAFGGYFKFVDQAPAHEFIRQRWLPGDLVITTEPSLTELYLGNSAYFYLREKYDKNTRTYSTFSELEKSGQLLRMLDSKNELLQVLNECPNRFWLYTNWKITSTISIETDRLIREHFIPMYSRDETYVLLKK